MVKLKKKILHSQEKNHFWIPACGTVNTWMFLLENLITKILLELLKDLKTDHIFAHSDKQIDACLCHIICKKPIHYQAVILLVGGYYQL